MKIKKYTEYFECKHSINESYVYDTKEKVQKWLDKMNIRNYIINDDLSVDVDGSANLIFNNLTKISVKFNNIESNFSVSENNLTTLENCPKSVKGDFGCANNWLNSLQHCPKFIGGDFYCHNNSFTSLLGIPIDINLNKLKCGDEKLVWNWLETIISENESNITYHLNWINKNKSWIPEDFLDKFGYLLEFEHYTKTLKN